MGVVSLKQLRACGRRGGAAVLACGEGAVLSHRSAASHWGLLDTSSALVDVTARPLAQAERLQLYDHRAIADVLSRSNGHRGRTALTKATATEPKLTRSELDARFLDLVHKAGLPEPQTNLPLIAVDHPDPEVDFYWPTHRLVVETDGWTDHGTRTAFKRGRRKDAALVACGYRVSRFT